MPESKPQHELSEQVKGIITQPDATFKELAAREESPLEALQQFVIPLLIMGAVSSFLGGLFAEAENAWANAALRAVTAFIVQFISLVAGGYFVKWITPYMGGDSSPINSYRLVFYATLPAYLAQIVSNLHVHLSFLELFGLYSFWLYYKAAPHMLGIDQTHQAGFSIAANFSILMVKIGLAYALIYLYNTMGVQLA